MKLVISRIEDSAALFMKTSGDEVQEARQRLVTRFGDMVDVRNRGAFKVSGLAGSHAQPAPAVVRLWTDDKCREMTPHHARSLAAQLLEAAALAEQQNG